MGDDLALLAILIREALSRLDVSLVDLEISHEELKATLRAVLDENGSQVRLEPIPAETIV